MRVEENVYMIEGGLYSVADGDVALVSKMEGEHAMVKNDEYPGHCTDRSRLSVHISLRRQLSGLHVRRPLRRVQRVS